MWFSGADWLSRQTPCICMLSKKPYSLAEKVCNRRRHHSRQNMTAKCRRLATDATGCLAASRRVALGVWRLATDATGCLVASRRVALGVWRLATDTTGCLAASHRAALGVWRLATRCLQSFVAYNRPLSAPVATVAMRELEYNLQLF